MQVQQQRITKGGEVRRDRDFNIFSGWRLLIWRQQIVRCRQVDDGFAHDVARDASELKQAVEQVTHVLGCFDHALKIGGGLFVELAEGIQDDL